MTAPDREVILGVDYGTHWVGLAICDPTGSYAVPIKCLTGLTGRALSRRIMSVVRERGVRLVVIGCPVENVPDSNRAVHQVISKVNQLKQSLEKDSVDVFLQDESYSSFAAVQIRSELDTNSDRNQKKWIDSSAAVIILQSYLDEKAKLAIK